MPISFPLTLPLDGIEASSFDLDRVDAIASDRVVSVPIELKPPRWKLTVKTNMLTPPLMDTWKSWIEALDAGKQSFWGYDPRRPRPLAYPIGVAVPGGWNGVGAFLMVATPAMPARRLSIGGLPSGYVVSVGDYVAINFGTNRGHHRALETVTANGSGVAVFDVTPNVRVAAPSGSGQGVGIALFGAVCAMRLIPGSYRPPRYQYTSEIEFEAIEVRP